MKSGYIQQKYRWQLVACKLSAQYPDSFIDKDEHGNVINLEPISLINTMKNRTNFLNRAPKTVTNEVPVKR